jgi:hypothetical protein
LTDEAIVGLDHDVRMARELAAQIDKLEERLKLMKDGIASRMQRAERDFVVVDDIPVRVRVDHRERFDRERFRKALLHLGVQPTVIHDAAQQSYDVSEVRVVTLRGK